MRKGLKKNKKQKGNVIIAYVSPVTAALWESLPLPPSAPVSIYFFALSQASPAVFKKRAIKIPHAVANISIAATTLAPSRGCPV